MRMKFILLLMLVVALLVACGGDEPVAVTVEAEQTSVPTREPTKPSETEPTAEPVPTNEPMEAPTSEPTAEPEPTVEPTAEPTAEPTSEPETVGSELVELVQIDEGGISVRVPAGYSVQIFGDTAELAPPNAASSEEGAFSVSGGPYLEDESFESLQTDIGDLLSDFNDVSEIQSFSGASGEAFSIDFAHAEDELALTGRVIVIDQGNQSAALFGFAGSEAWSALSETFDAIARSIEFFEPLVAATPDDSGEEATTDDGQQDGDNNGQSMTDVVPDGDAGMACFSARGDGLTCLREDGTWQQITADNSAIGSDYVVAMTTCNGTIMMAHISGLSRYDGSTWQEYDDGWGFATPTDVACDANDGIWIAHFEGVSYFDGGEWVTFSADDILNGESLVYDVEISADGTVWVLASGAIASYSGGEWTTYAEGAGLNDRYFFAAMTLAPDGTVWAAHSNGLLYLEDGAWAEVASPRYLSPEKLIATANGDKWVGTFSDGIVIFNGASTTRINRANDELSSDGVGALAIDDLGRVWVGTEYGLNIWDGTEWISYDMDSSDLMNNAIEAMAVLGAGPQLPAHVNHENGALVGRVPVSDKQVELCVEAIYSSYDGDTPCDGQPLAFQTSADADGQFIFDDVPVGNYLIAFETDDGWVEVKGEYGLGAQFFPVRSAETTDVGELTIEEE